MDTFLDSLVTSNAGQIADEKGIDDHSEDSETGDESVGHHALYDLPTDEEDSEEQSESSSSTEDERGPTYSPSAEQDIYGRIKKGEDKKAAYVPPHLRDEHIGTDGTGKKFSEVPGPLSRDLVRRLNGQLNRLSEDSLDPVLFEIGRLYNDYSTSVVSQELFSAMKSVCVHPTQMMSTLIPCYAALIAGLHVTRGAEVGGRALEAVGQELCASLMDTQPPSNKRLLNLGLILGYLYILGVAYHGLIFDVLHVVSDRCDMLDLELLPPLLRLCSNWLRKDDATAFREELAHVRLNVEKLITASAAKEENFNRIGRRAELVLEACMECKSKKTRRAMLGDQERIVSLRKWLGKVRSSNRGSAAVPLRISWKDLTCANLRGRWWLVGAAWSGSGECVTPASQDRGNEASSTLDCGGHKEATEVKGGLTIPNELSSLAVALSMGTETRKKVFYSLMSSADFEDATDSILQLNLRNKFQREVTRVILTCCCKESTYNPFYAYVGAKLCEHQGSFKFSFQLAVWDTFLKLKDMSPREASNLARFIAHLIIHHHLSIGVLKAIDTKDTSSRRVVLFLRVIFRDLFSVPDEGEFIALFKRLQDDPQKKNQLHSKSAGETTNGIDDQSEGEASDTEELQRSPNHLSKAAIRNKVLLLILTYASKPPAGLANGECKSYRKRVEAIMNTLQ